MASATKNSVSKKKFMRVLILANGEAPSEELAQRLAAEHRLLLATDGAAHRAVGLGLRPDIICGDFDSVDLEVAKQEFPEAEFVLTWDQDFADLEKALQIARERGASEITIIGAGGGRIDHALGGILLLLRYASEIPLCIVDDSAEVWAVSGMGETLGEQSFSVSPGATISVLSAAGTAQVTLTGVKWPLEDTLLPIGTHGISNVAESEIVKIQVRGGTVLVCHLTPRTKLF